MFGYYSNCIVINQYLFSLSFSNYILNVFCSQIECLLLKVKGDLDLEWILEKGKGEKR